MLEEQEGLSRPAAFYIGAKLRHKRFWRLKPTVCMLVEEMPRPLYSVAGGCEHLPHLEELRLVDCNQLMDSALKGLTRCQHLQVPSSWM